MARKKTIQPIITPPAQTWSDMRGIANGMTSAQIARMASDEMLKAGNGVNEEGKLKSSFLDPWNLASSLSSRPKPTRVTWLILRRMALSCKPVSAVIQTRQNQVAAFTQIPRRTGDIGFRITTSDPLKRPTDSDREAINKMTQWFMRMGESQTDGLFYLDERRRDNFDSFVRKIVRDTLTLDAVCFEKQMNARGVPHAIWALDPATIKFAAESFDFDPATGRMIPRQDERTGGLPVRYVQELYNGQKVAVFNERELAYAVRNPRTDIDMGGYGLSELEILMETVTNILFAEQYNAKYFSQNAVPQGVLTIAGKYTPEALESFKRQWVAQVSGVGNAWRVPIMAIDEPTGGVDFKPFKESNRNMQFALYLEFLLSTVCSVYTIDPSEIGYAIKGSGGASMVEHSGATKFDFSKDKGLRPLLKWLSHVFNEHIVQEVVGDGYVFEWVGIDSMSEKDKVELTTKKLQNGILTVNEIRAIEDIDPIQENWANAPASPALLQVYMADLNFQREKEKEMQAQAQQQANMLGAPSPLGPDGQPLPPSPDGAPQPGAQPGAPEAGGPSEALPGGPGAPKEMRTPNASDNGVEMPLDQIRKKETNTGQYEDARAAEKKGGERRRAQINEGETGIVTKSFGDDGVLEIEVE